jgi:hypothetical protein
MLSNLCAPSTRRFISVSIYSSCSSFFKRLASLVVATMSPGNVHTALKRQAPLRLLIHWKQLEQSHWRSEICDKLKTSDLHQTGINCIAYCQHRGTPQPSGVLLRCAGVCSWRRQLKGTYFLKCLKSKIRDRCLFIMLYKFNSTIPIYIVT